MHGRQRSAVSWRQGNVVTLEAAKELNLLAPECDDQHFAVVASHDCDICLMYCDPISDIAITVAQREMLKQYTKGVTAVVA